MKSKKVLIFSLTFTVIAVFTVINLAGIFSEKKPLSFFGKIEQFQLIDHENNKFSLSDLEGSIWVVDFIFTSCPGPCPLMTSKMRKLQNHYSKEPDVKFLSISIDPENDTPEVLQDYAKKFSADLSQWTFLTGQREAIVSLAQNSFKLAAGGEDPNLHTTKFVLVDQSSQIRGYYDSQSEGFFEKIDIDINTLLK